MRILHTSDWHLGKTLEGNSRLEEQKLFLEEFVRIVEEHDIDLILHAGDVYDSFNPSSQAEQLFYDTLKRISNNGRRAIIVVAGNHDNAERLEAVTPLARDHGILIFGLPSTVFPVGQYGRFHIVNSGPGYVEINLRNEKVVVLTMPFPSEKRLGVFLEGENDKELRRSYSEKMGLIFQKLSRHFRDDTINLMVSHLYVVGGETSDSERSFHLGGTYAVDHHHLPLKSQYIALGHLHKMQSYNFIGTPIYYSGSPLQYSLRERNNLNSVIVFDVTPGKKVVPKRVPLHIHRAIELWRCDSVEEAIEKCRENTNNDAWTYLEIKTPTVISPADILEMRNLKSNIISILPIFPDSEGQEIAFTNVSDFNISEIFSDFYFSKRMVEPDEKVVKLFLSFFHGEEDKIVETD